MERTIPVFRFDNLPCMLLRNDAIQPTRNNDGDAGYDLYCTDNIRVDSRLQRLWNRITMFFGGNHPITEWNQCTKISTGIAMEIPYGWEGKIEDRSGLGSKLLKVHGGVIDSTYRGDIVVCLTNHRFTNYYFKRGDKVAQIVVQPCFTGKLKMVDKLSDSSRQDKGFGSSGA